MKNHLKPVLVWLFSVITLTVKAQVPQLSSYPSASAVLFLDFDGHTVDATSWNYNGPIVCGASGLNNTQITEVFNRVAEDYRPFNINVTTDSTVFLAAPAVKRMRVILTVSSSWYGSAGGVAFVGSFVWGDDTPCFVFSALLAYNVKRVAEAASHEAGHTMGLYHQARYDASCVKISDYHSGTGTGEIGWAPIMGVGYYQNLTLWNNGPNSFGCTNYQSDLDVLTTDNGFSYRTDDYAATFAGATNVPFTGGDQFTVNGVTERNTDQDMIKFTIPSYGQFQLNAIPYNVGTGNSGSNLDMQVTLYNSVQTQLNVYNPGVLLSSVIDTFLNTGTYYLKIEGKGNVYAPNYASLGSYALQATYSTEPLPLRKLQLKGELSGDKHKFNWIIEADEAVVKQVLEISTDGRSFNPVNEPAAADRAYVYIPAVAVRAQYRLHVTFDNDKQYYSNIVTIPARASDKRPQLMNTVVSNDIMVNSPGNFSYIIYDLNGRLQAKGNLTTGVNTIAAGQLTGAVYMIRFTNGAEQWTDKFMRQ